MKYKQGVVRACEALLMEVYDESLLCYVLLDIFAFARELGMEIGSP